MSDAAAPKSEYRVREAFPTWAWIKDAGPRDALYCILYPVRTWRCRLFGHKWGDEQHDYDPNIMARMESWRECQRPGCEGWWQTFHYMGGERVWG